MTSSSRYNSAISDVVFCDDVENEVVSLLLDMTRAHSPALSHSSHAHTIATHQHDSEDDDLDTERHASDDDQLSAPEVLAVLAKQKRSKGMLQHLEDSASDEWRPQETKREFKSQIEVLPARVVIAEPVAANVLKRKRISSDFGSSDANSNPAVTLAVTLRNSSAVAALVGGQIVETRKPHIRVKRHRSAAAAATNASARSHWASQHTAPTQSHASVVDAFSKLEQKGEESSPVPLLSEAERHLLQKRQIELHLKLQAQQLQLQQWFAYNQAMSASLQQQQQQQDKQASSSSSSQTFFPLSAGGVGLGMARMVQHLPFYSSAH